jgi:hypothetical protein
VARNIPVKDNQNYEIDLTEREKAVYFSVNLTKITGS